MASNKKNTSNSNVSKGMKYKTKNNIIMGTVIAVLILSIVGYFVYISGFLAKVVPAVKVEQTVNGQTKTVAKIYTPELNYYYAQLVSVYQMYGMNIGEEYLNTMNEEMQKTNGQLLYDAAAEQAMNVYLVNDYASKDPDFYCGAKRYAEHELYFFSLRAQNNNTVTDKYLAYLYGTGMSSRMYKDIVARQETTQEYEQYIRQFKFMPSYDELMAVYNEDSSLFERASFNSFFFSAVSYPDGEAEKMAQAVADASVSSGAFSVALTQQLGPEMSEAMGLTANGNETYVESLTKTVAEDTSKYPEGFADFVFDKGNIGTATVLTNELGSYVVFLDDIKVNDEATFTYRVLKLENEAYKNLEAGEVPTDADVAKGLTDCQNKANEIIAGTTDERSFVVAVKDNTDDYDSITTGGYVNGTLASAFEGENVSADDQVLGTWLTDPARKPGDMIAITSADNRSVSIYYFSYTMPSWMNTLAQEKVTTEVNNWSTNELQVQNTVPLVSYDVVDTLTYRASN